MPQRTDRFEIGSISKGLTGLLFADMIERGEVRADTRLGELLPVSGELSQVQLSQLATHTSGLPPQLPTPRQYGKNYWATLTAGNPYDGTVQQRLDALDGVSSTRRRGRTPTWPSSCSVRRWRRPPTGPTGTCSASGSCTRSG